MSEQATQERAEFLYVVPNGCLHCGHQQHHHGLSWAADVGYHKWVAPTDVQRLARMRARRAAGLTYESRLQAIRVAARPHR